MAFATDALDYIIADAAPFWNFVRILHILLAVVFFVGFATHMLRRWHGRRLQGNLLMVSILLLVMNSAFTALARLDGPVSFRLPIGIFALTIGIVCVWEPHTKRERKRREWDLL